MAGRGGARGRLCVCVGQQRAGGREGRGGGGRSASAVSAKLRQALTTNNERVAVARHVRLREDYQPAIKMRDIALETHQCLHASLLHDQL